MKHFFSNRYFLALFSTITMMTSCKSDNSEQMAAGNDEMESEIVAIKLPPKGLDSDSKSQSAAPIEISKKVIKDGRMSVQTRDLTASKQAMDAVLKGLGAYYEREDLQNDDFQASYDLTIRVASDKFETLISRIEEGEAEIKSKSINARDVTQQYVDIETRLANKREYLKRYRELLAKAATVKDILAIQENIRGLEEEIESREAQLKSLKNQISYSTLQLNIFQKKDFVYNPEQQGNFFEKVKNSLSNGWQSAVGFVLFIISIWPFVILLLVGVVLWRKFKSRHKKA